MKKATVIFTMLVALTFILGPNLVNAATIYGVKHPPARQSAEIYKIDLGADTCTTELVATSSDPTVASSSYNGNAYDFVNDRYYYTCFNNSTTLYRIDDFSTAPNTVVAGVLDDFTDDDLSGGVSNGTFYKGKYYFIEHNTDSLYEVAFNEDGDVSSVNFVEDMGDNSFYFGDIAYNWQNGVLYGGASDSEAEIFSYDATNGYKQLNTSEIPDALQIAFGDDGVLYGYSIANNNFYEIDTSTGVLTEVCSSDTDFSDLASGVNKSFKEYSLCASQDMNVGNVQVWNDDSTLYVKYALTDPDACLTETHLHAAGQLDSIPQTKKGNPIPGQFEYSMEHGCVASYTYTIPLNGWSIGDELQIAAHAVVEIFSSDSENACASAVQDFTIGTIADGTALVSDPERTDPAEALGPPDSYENNYFYSLGFGGSLTLAFETFIGGELTVYEVTNGTYPAELAEVFVSRDGAEWVYLGKADNSDSDTTGRVRSSTFLLDACYQYVRLDDATDATVHSDSADAFDVDAVCASFACEEETAWGNGAECGDTETYGFPWKNWATYFTYTVE